MMPLRIGMAVALAVVLMAVGCGDEASEHTSEATPNWARVSPEQNAEARRHGVPVALQNALGMRFVLIPAGRFRMGSPDSEVGHSDDEPLRVVTITHPFYMQVFETTNEQVRRWNPRHRLQPCFKMSVDGADQPAIVSREDALEIARVLTGLSQMGPCRLPTEAEWEYACRAGTTTAYSWGNDPADAVRYANGLDEVSRDAFDLKQLATVVADDGNRVSAPVGSYAPNRWGLYDMHGNEWEWCSDWYGDVESKDASDPQGPSSGTHWVIRGGDWLLGDAVQLRSAARSGVSPSNHVSLRLVVELPLPAK